MARFRRIDDTIVCTFHVAEYDLLRALYADLSGCVEAQDSNDPRFRRLFPPSILDAEASLLPTVDEQLLAWREASLFAANTWLDGATHQRSMYRLDVASSAIDAVLQLINDMRLMLGASIDIDAFDRDSLTTDDDRQHTLAIIDHLAWWQDELLTLITDEMAD